VQLIEDEELCDVVHKIEACPKGLQCKTWPKMLASEWKKAYLLGHAATKLIFAAKFRCWMQMHSANRCETRSHKANGEKIDLLAESRTVKHNKFAGTDYRNAIDRVERDPEFCKKYAEKIIQAIIYPEGAGSNFSEVCKRALVVYRNSLGESERDPDIRRQIAEMDNR
jgi:hypothetical protein